MDSRRLLAAVALTTLLLPSPAVLRASDPHLLDPNLHHLRIGGPREWAEFSETPEAEALSVTFDGQPNDTEWTLELRQQDVKQRWRVQLNGTNLGELHQDENDMLVCFAVPAGVLAANNTLTIEQRPDRNEATDDIRVGELRLYGQSTRDLLSEATVTIEVQDAENGRPLPSRVTMRNSQGALQQVWVPPDPRLAVRPGTIFTSDGRATFSLPAGRYTIHAGRGFEYSLATTTLNLAAGESAEQTLAIRREVDTADYVACDTHVHTLTHSGHGDATILERMVTIAAEGIELPIATDHNVQIDHDPFAREVGVRQYFTPVIGNEVTTPVGHFNVFPVPPSAGVPDHKLDDWADVFAEIDRVTGAPIIVLNHARDLHSGVRPFGPRHFNDAVGESLDSRPHGFNAMEVINSGATQTDVLQLFADWMSLLNHGDLITPVGSSDSHDVARHFVGQGRTYIRGDDSDPGNIDVDEAMHGLRQGRVMVSYGLLVQMAVDKHTSGDLVPVSGSSVDVDLSILGPHWVQADHIALYANGCKLREQSLDDDVTASATEPGVKWRGRWTVPVPDHDVHLVAIARGPGIDEPYWRTAKPYQPTSPDWAPQVIGCSGALWLDCDGDGQRTSAREYAARLWDASDGDLGQLLKGLASMDAAIAAQAASYYQSAGGSMSDPQLTTALRSAPASVRAGFESFGRAWRESQVARIRSVE